MSNLSLANAYQLAWIIHENVPTYPLAHLQETLGPCGFVFQEAKIDPRRFGEPNSRVRFYRMGVNKALAIWSLPQSMEEIVNNLFPMPSPERPLRLDASIYFDACSSEILREKGSRMDTRGSALRFLSDSGLKHLLAYEQKASANVIYDVSQNPTANRGRTSLKDGSLPCSAISSRLWSVRHQRTFLATEALQATGVPVSQHTATAAQVEPSKLANASEAAIFTMAGNSMHVPSVGLALLLAVLGVECK